MNEKMTYKDAGVDTKEGERAVSLMKEHVKKTFNENVLTGLGGFGGLFRLPVEGMKEPVLVSGTPQDDTVQFYRALSNYRFKDYYTAETNFKSFLDKFPRSPFSENAEFLRVDCLYKSTYRWELDQTPTYAALVAINEYQMKYPGSLHSAVCRRMSEDLEERLDYKAYQNAYLYYKMEDYKAARVALRNVLKDDADNIYREDILYYTALASYKYALMSVTEKQKERYMVFVDDYLNFVGEYPDSSSRCKELEHLYKKAKEKI